MKKILIIGSSGYIGKSLTLLLKKKIKILNYSKKKVNVLKVSSLKKIISKNIDLIINLSGQNTSNKKKLKKIIIDGNKNILKAINDINHKINYLFISTCLVYGHVRKPANEEKKILSTKNFYAKMKLRAERYVKKNSSNFVIIRLANVYNKNADQGFFKKLFIQIRKKKIIFSNLLTQRNMIHLDDVIKSIKLIINNNKMFKDKTVINIGNENIKLTKIAKILKSLKKRDIKIINKKIPLSSDVSQIISINKLKKLKKWKKNSIEKTFKQTLKNEKFI